MDQTRRLVPLREAASTLGVSLQTAYRLAGRGELPLKKLGARTFVKVEDLDKFVNGLPAPVITSK